MPASARDRRPAVGNGRIMTETTSGDRARRAVPIWVQVLIWAVLIGLLVLLAIGLSRRSRARCSPAIACSDFELALFSGYEYNGQAQVEPG